MLGPYRSILAEPGALAFSSAGALARAEISMVGLGSVLLVHATTGSYALGGAVSAVIGITSAVISPIVARIVDRRGQAVVLRWTAALHAAAILLLVALAVARVPFALLLVAGLLVGATSISVGSMVRARWAAIVSGSALQTAFALESVIDELVFIVGPVLVTALAAAGAPAAGPLLAAATTVAGDLLLAGQRRTEPAASGAAGDAAAQARTRGVLRTRGMPVLVLVFLLAGGVFGSAEVTVAAFATAQGVPAAGGLVLGCWAAGSLTGGLVYGAIRWRSPLAPRFAVLAVVLALLTAPMLAAPPVALLALVFLAAGIAIAPVLATGTSLVEAIVPAARLTEGLAWANTAISLTYALAAGVAGAVIDRAGPAAGFAIPVLCAFAAALAAVAGVGRLSRTGRRTVAAAPAAP